jgi:hypothetical protein
MTGGFIGSEDDFDIFSWKMCILEMKSTRGFIEWTPASTTVHELNTLVPLLFPYCCKAVIAGVHYVTCIV